MSLRARIWGQRFAFVYAAATAWLLFRVGARIGPVRRIPRLGWVVSDPGVARGVLTDSQHFTVFEEGGAGHLWVQVLGGALTAVVVLATLWLVGALGWAAGLAGVDARWLKSPIGLGA